MGMTRTRSQGATRRGGRSDDGRRAALVVGALVLAALLLWLAFGDGDGGDEPGGAVEEVSHVHGLQIPAWGDGDVYVSTHQGAFRIGSDDWAWVSEQPHDFMGFAAHPADEGVLYSSGHPAPGSDLPNPIGFMVSTDGGATWQPRSLQGEVDFHVMAVHPEDGDVLYGFDGRRGLLRTSDAGERWEELPSPALDQTPPVGLAVGAGDGELYAAIEGGLLHSTDDGASWEQVLERPVSAVHVDVSDPQHLLAYAVDEQGSLLRSEDGGASWEPLGLTLGDDAASHVAVVPGDPQTVWVGTFGQSLWRTTDGGQQWDQPVTDGTRTDG